MKFAYQLYFATTVSIFGFAFAFYSFAEEQPLKKENDSSVNVKPLPKQDNILLNSDKFELSGKTGLFKQCGNAVLTQVNITITANCISGKRNDDGSYKFIAAVGSPATLNQIDSEKGEELIVKAGLIEYTVQEKYFKIHDEADLKISNLSKDSLEILANKIDIDNKNEQHRKISATGNPLKIVIKKLDTTDLEAVSKELFYNTGTSELKLSEDVIANLELGQISAGVFDYNGKTKESSFTRSSQEQIEIIQTKKKEQ